MQQTNRYEPWPGVDWPPPRPLVPAWVWQLVVAAAVAGALLLAFQRVVQGAVSDGALRRQQDALYAMEFSHCNTMGNTRVAAECFQRLGPRPYAGVRAAVTPDLVALDH